MFTSYSGAQEWYLPSWRVEPKYSTDVLLGNWLEERKKFVQDPEKTCKSIYGKDYVQFPAEVPDRTVMRKSMKKLSGLPKKQILTHHNEPNNRHLVTLYDDNFNRHGCNPLLPPLRKWSRHKLAWIPEKLDFPLVENMVGFDPLDLKLLTSQYLHFVMPKALHCKHEAAGIILRKEPPTNYGLFEHLTTKWRHQGPGVMNSVYTVSYIMPPISAYPPDHRHPITSHLVTPSHGHLRPRTSDGYQ